MRSLFLRTFLWFWLTVLLTGTAVTFFIQHKPLFPVDRKVFFSGPWLPSQAKAAAETFENSGAAALNRYLDQLESELPIQAAFFDADGRELLGRPASSNARDLAHLSAFEDRTFVVVNLAAHRAVAGGKTYSLVVLQEPSDEYRSRVFDRPPGPAALELPAVILLGSGLLCYFAARHVTKPVLSLRVAAAGISEGRLETRVEPKWTRRRDEIGELSRDFDRMAQRIEALVAAQKRLLGDVSHELRSPLSRLVVALGLLKQRPPNEAQELLTRAGIEVRRLDTLIGQLLTLARIDSGMHTDAQPFDLAEVVEEVARDAGFEARAGGRKVAVTNADTSWMNGSEELMRSAIENVVRNAIRYTDEGTQVEITLDRRDSKAMLTIRDHGPGVAEDALKDIFVPFRRIPSHEGSSDGAGLGLAITERAVRLHGGAVRARNAHDGGLAVEVELPNVRALR